MANRFYLKFLKPSFQKGDNMRFTNSGKWCKNITPKDLCAFNIIINESYLSALLKNSIANKAK